ncbi:MAG: hypothetical protein H0W50_08190 [Parachlamydiaceae bacterium]|nr:hypothetical protein [Parachlamydiaceae bacterium]
MAEQKSIQERVVKACEQILQHHNYVNLTEVFKVIGVLQPKHEESWRQGKISNLESVIQGNPQKIIEAIYWVDMWVSREGLIPIEIESYARISGRKQELQYTEEGDSENETLFKTYYFSPKLSELDLQKIRARLEKSRN